MADKNIYFVTIIIEITGKLISASSPKKVASSPLPAIFLLTTLLNLTTTFTHVIFTLAVVICTRRLRVDDFLDTVQQDDISPS